MALVRIESTGAVRTLTLARPEKRNALNEEMLEALETAFSVEPPAEERVTVLRAEGQAFCSGLDLRQRRESLGRPSPIQATLRAIETYALPVVAVVQGAAIAGGNELALHCDFVVASTAARFAMPLAQLGLSINWFLCKKLLEVGGPVATRELLLLGDTVGAEWMFAHGLIARLAEPERLDAEAGKIVDRLAANAPLALKAMKRILVREMEFRDAIAHADLDQLTLATGASEDCKEGIAARLEKRRPVFRGV